MSRTGKSRAVVSAALLLSLAACGQKGPLYLPDQGGEVVTRPAGQTQSQGQQSQQQSPEVAPQPSTQTPPDSNTKPEEKKPQTPK
jgi:predicted small lipoprotein YifL